MMTFSPPVRDGLDSSLRNDGVGKGVLTVPRATARYAAAALRRAREAARLLRRSVAYTVALRRGPAEVTTISVEHGFLKLMVSQGMRVLDFRIAPTSPRFFREGLISNSPGMAGILVKTLEDMAGGRRRIIASVPGYQTALRGLQLPSARGMEPRLVIPREAQRVMGVSAEHSLITWHSLYNGRDRSQWIVLSATRRSVTSLTDMVQRANIEIAALELRPFALARAANLSDAVIVWTAADGCDVVVVRDFVPLSHQAAFWGAEPVVEGTVLVNRLTEVVEQAIVLHDEQNPEILLPDDAPLIVCGSPLNSNPRVGAELATNLRRTLGEIASPLDLPPDFPLNDLVVNVGLALWEA